MLWDSFNYRGSVSDIVKYYLKKQSPHNFWHSYLMVHKRLSTMVIWWDINGRSPLNLELYASDYGHAWDILNLPAWVKWYSLANSMFKTWSPTNQIRVSIKISKLKVLTQVFYLSAVTAGKLKRFIITTFSFGFGKLDN